MLPGCSLARISIFFFFFDFPNQGNAFIEVTITTQLDIGEQSCNIAFSVFL